MNDIQLFNAIQNGCQQSFGTFYDRHAPIVLGVIMAVVPERELGEQLLEEAFWQAWQEARTYDSQRCSPLVWVCARARRLALQEQKTQSIWLNGLIQELPQVAVAA